MHTGYNNYYCINRYQSHNNNCKWCSPSFEERKASEKIQNENICTQRDSNPQPFAPQAGALDHRPLWWWAVFKSLKQSCHINNFNTWKYQIDYGLTFSCKFCTMYSFKTSTFEKEVQILSDILYFHYKYNNIRCDIVTFWNYP